MFPDEPLCHNITLDGIPILIDMLGDIIELDNDIKSLKQMIEVDAVYIVLCISPNKHEFL